jgi:hypothetical protein
MTQKSTDPIMNVLMPLMFWQTRNKKQEQIWMIHLHIISYNSSQTFDNRKMQSFFTDSIPGKHNHSQIARSSSCILQRLHRIPPAIRQCKMLEIWCHVKRFGKSNLRHSWRWDSQKHGPIDGIKNAVGRTANAYKLHPLTSVTVHHSLLLFFHIDFPNFKWVIQLFVISWLKHPIHIMIFNLLQFWFWCLSDKHDC